jgi:hypothetical protein
MLAGIGLLARKKDLCGIVALVLAALLLECKENNARLISLLHLFQVKHYVLLVYM